MRSLLLGWLLLLIFVSTSGAHFGAIIPSDDIISQSDPMLLGLQLKFIHPMERHYLEMVRPQAFGVLNRGQVIDLLDTLQQRKSRSPEQDSEFTYWSSDFRIKRPGDYTFYVAPQPYWEPSEDLYIVHFAKVCVNALGLSDGWDQPVGLETEIVPLTRPYGLWTNNLFSGQVLLKGKPAPFAEIEVEYLNESAENRSIVVPPEDPYITQVVKADANGVFHYAMPRAGWWGFSALSTADWTLVHDGVAKGVEIGAVFWVHTRDMQ